MSPEHFRADVAIESARPTANSTSFSRTPSPVVSRLRQCESSASSGHPGVQTRRPRSPRESDDFATPRKLQEAHSTCGDGTPPPRRRRGIVTTPPPVRCRGSPPPAPIAVSTSNPLMRALHTDSAEAVRNICEKDAEASRGLFWDDGCEPPLCVAVRARCSPEVVSVLLQYGADANAVGPDGLSPLAILASLPCSSCHDAWAWPGFNIAQGSSAERNRREELCMTLADLLLSAGAHAAAIDDYLRLPGDHALMAGNAFLLPRLTASHGSG